MHPSHPSHPQHPRHTTPPPLPHLHTHTHEAQRKRMWMGCGWDGMRWIAPTKVVSVAGWEFPSESSRRATVTSMSSISSHPIHILAGPLVAINGIPRRNGFSHTIAGYQRGHSRIYRQPSVPSSSYRYLIPIAWGSLFVKGNGKSTTKPRVPGVPNQRKEPKVRIPLS